MHNTLWVGLVVGGLLMTAVLTIALTPKKLDPHLGLIAGLALLLPAVAFLLVAENARSITFLALGAGVTGVAAGLGYLCELQTVNQAAPPDRRSEVVSTFLIVGYAALSLPVIGVGAVAAMSNRRVADALFGAVVIVIAASALLFEVHQRTAQPRASNASSTA